MKTPYKRFRDWRSARRRAEKLRGKVVLVTGASRGIGAEVVRQAAGCGAVVVMVARSAEPMEAIASELRAEGHTVDVEAVDLSDFDAVDALADRVVARHGGVDVLIHNAARSIRRPVTHQLERFHDYERTMHLNYFSPVRLTLRLLPSLRERKGAISLVLTIGVLIPGPYFASYLASKSALDAFGDSLAGELAHEVAVSQVYLPLVRTEMMAPTEGYAERTDILTPRHAAHWILDGVAFRQRKVIPLYAKYYAFANRLRPGNTTRVLNVLYRTFPPRDAQSEYPRLRAFFERYLGGTPI